MMDTVLPILLAVCGLVGAIGWGQFGLLGGLCGALYGGAIGSLVTRTDPALALGAAYLLAGSIYAELGFIVAQSEIRQFDQRRGTRRWIRITAASIVFGGLVLLWPAHWAWVKLHQLMRGK